MLGIALVMSQGWACQLLHGVLGFLRAIPVLMLIFWIYFLLPMVMGMDVPGTVSVVCALSLIGGAYLAHGVAAGIRAVPQGQWNAGAALGMSRWQVLRWVVLSQVLSAMLPSFRTSGSPSSRTALWPIVGVGELSPPRSMRG